MKRAFTLIELLVVIAIIAILAAILFPVFAQAKVAAKKTSALSAQKQIATSMFLYTTDYDDQYARNDDCVINSSLLGKHNDGVVGVTNPETKCQYNFSSGQGSFAWRMNHFSWPKWLMPYTKNVDLFFHPGRGISDALGAGTFSNSHEWSDWGETTFSFAINLAITGSLNTHDGVGGIYGTTPATQRVYRNSWTGGTQTGLVDPAKTLLFGESMSPTSGVLPTGILNGEYTNQTVTVYPGIVREQFVADAYNKTGTSCQNSDPGSTLSTSKVFGGGMVVGFADGHAKFMSINQIAAQTPKASELVTGWTNSSCFVAGSTARLGPTGNTSINLKIDYPLWGLSAQ